MPLHVVQLGPYPPPEGGISRNILAIRDELLATGHRSTIIATSRSSSVDGAEDVHHPSSAFELISLLRSIKGDVVHLHIGGNVSARVLALAAATAFFARGPSVLTMHSGHFPMSKAAENAAPTSIAGNIFRRFSRVIAVNERIADVFRRYGVDDGCIEVILPFAPRRPDPNVAVSEPIAAFISRRSPLILSVGGLEPDYDPLFQVAAFGELLEKHPHTGLLMVGDGSMRAEVESAIAASGHAERIMLAGNISHPIVLHLIAKADVAIRTTLFDGDAISVREALHLGTPVVASDAAERPEGAIVYLQGDHGSFLNAMDAALKQGRGPWQSGSNENSLRVLAIYEDLAQS